MPLVSVDGTRYLGYEKSVSFLLLDRLVLPGVVTASARATDLLGGGSSSCPERSEDSNRESRGSRFDRRRGECRTCRESRRTRDIHGWERQSGGDANSERNGIDQVAVARSCFDAGGFVRNSCSKGAELVKSGVVASQEATGWPRLLTACGCCGGAAIIALFGST